MDQEIRNGVPLHLWIVGVLALLWNAFGAYDYVMTRTQGAAYVRTVMPGSDAEAVMAYINAFPLYVSLGWGLGVWMGLLGSVLLLMRSRHAVTAFAVSMAGAIVGLGWQLLNPMPLAEAHQGFNGMVPYIIILIAIALFLYARAQQAKGVLR